MKRSDEQASGKKAQTGISSSVEGEPPSSEISLNEIELAAYRKRLILNFVIGSGE